MLIQYLLGLSTWTNNEDFSHSLSVSPSTGRSVWFWQGQQSSSLAAFCSVNSWLYPGLPFGDPAWLEQVHLAACQLLGISRALVAGGEISFWSGSTSTFCLFALPCILCIAQVSFANLERVEVLGLPGSEGELRVRGDKTVTTTSDANLFVAWLEISLIGFMQNG